MTGFSSSLYDQMHSQPYSPWIQGWVDSRIQANQMDVQSYAPVNQSVCDNISMSIMIINVPMIALFVYLIVLKRRPFYYDSLIFVLHFFSLFLLSWVVLDWAGSLFELLNVDLNSYLGVALFLCFTFLLPFVYAILSIKKFLGLYWYWSIPAGLWVLIALFLAKLFYRFIILLITISLT